eukprot:scaffold12163_cov111-Isochrysis_galbana.AAC.4
MSTSSPLRALEGGVPPPTPLRSKAAFASDLRISSRHRKGAPGQRCSQRVFTSARKAGESVATKTVPFGWERRKASTYGSYSRGGTGRPDAALARYFPLSDLAAWGGLLRPVALGGGIDGSTRGCCLPSRGRATLCIGRRAGRDGRTQQLGLCTPQFGRQPWLEPEVGAHQPVAFSPVTRVPRVVVRVRLVASRRGLGVVHPVVIGPDRPRLLPVHGLALLARQLRSVLLRLGCAGANRPKIVLERVGARRAVEKGRAAGEADAGVLARRERAPVDDWVAGVELAEPDLVEREHQRGCEAVRLVVIRDAHRTRVGAGRASAPTHTRESGSTLGALARWASVRRHVRGAGDGDYPFISLFIMCDESLLFTPANTTLVMAKTFTIRAIIHARERSGATHPQRLLNRTNHTIGPLFHIDAAGTLST